jgi:hypothetical protein
VKSLLVAILLSLAVAAPPPLDAATADAMRRKVERTLEARRWDEAIGLIEEYLREVERDPIMLYNAACAHCQSGRTAIAASTLLEAIKAGFREFDTMEEDPDLEPLRGHPTYTAILEARDRARAAPSAAPIAALEEWRRRHGEGRYRYEADAARRLQFASCLEDASHAEMKATLERQHDWLSRNLFPKLAEYDVLVAIPSPRDAKAYFADATTTGIYEHSRRRLVTRDTGQSLQHEFTHLMHYRHMETLRQTHPMWVQEGLASLFEDWEILPDGNARFLPNTRHNLALRAVNANAVLPWKRLFALDAAGFMAKSQLLYPQARSIFEFLAETGELGDFYAALCEVSIGLSREERGVAAERAIERAFGRPVAEVERDWKRWVKGRGAIDDTIGAGDGALGIEAADEADGARVRQTLPRSAARAAGLRIGDVIVGIDGKPVRSTRELRLAVAGKSAGDTISVRFRRDDEYGETPVTLRAYRGSVPPG